MTTTKIRWAYRFWLSVLADLKTSGWLYNVKTTSSSYRQHYFISLIKILIFYLKIWYVKVLTIWTFKKNFLYSEKGIKITWLIQKNISNLNKIQITYPVSILNSTNSQLSENSRKNNHSRRRKSFCTVHTQYLTYNQERNTSHSQWTLWQ